MSTFNDSRPETDRTAGPMSTAVSGPSNQTVQEFLECFAADPPSALPDEIRELARSLTSQLLAAPAPEDELAQLLVSWQQAFVTSQSKPLSPNCDGRTDATTGLPNRAALADDLTRQIGLWKRFDLPFALVQVSLDLESSTAPSPVLDEILEVGMAKFLQSISRDTDLVARIAEKRFVIVLPGNQEKHATDLAKRIVTAIEQCECPAPSGERFPINVTVATAEIAKGQTPETLLEGLEGSN